MNEIFRLEAARAIGRIRDSFSDHFGDELLTSPCFFILLLLFESGLGSTVSDLSRMISVSHATTERWLRILVDLQFVQGADNAIGSPRYQLTRIGREGIATCLDAAIVTDTPVHTGGVDSH